MAPSVDYGFAMGEEFEKHIAEVTCSSAPIIDNLLDTDFYKLLTLQFVWKYFRDVYVSSCLFSRSCAIPLARLISEDEIHRQFEYVQALRFTTSQLTWLANTKFYGKRGIFSNEFLDWLKDFKFSSYKLARRGDQWILTFYGLWPAVTLWEVPALAILSELRTRAVCRSIMAKELCDVFSRAEGLLFNKIRTLQGVNGLTFVEFGTRRRHSFFWQDYVIKVLRRELPFSFIGTSNMHHSTVHGLRTVGTSSHEVPMVLGALARCGRLTDNNGLIDLKSSQYEAPRLWQQLYHSIPLILLPDTWGSTQFLKNAPQKLADWGGLRVDSKAQLEAGDEYIAWLKVHGRDPLEKTLLFSDALDIDDLVRLYDYFSGRIMVTFGWGTLLTNDFRGCCLRDPNLLEPISLVCKILLANGQPVVKLSDTPNKRSGSKSEIKYYLDVFN